MRTSESASSIDAAAVAGSLLGFVVVYFALFGAGVVYILRLMREPPNNSQVELWAHAPARAVGIVPAAVLTGFTNADDPKAKA